MAAVNLLPVPNPGNDPNLRTIWENFKKIRNHFQYFNVKDYGAVGDGVTVDTTAIQAAYDAAAATVNTGTATGGAVVYAPAGRYLIGALEFDTPFVSFIGDGPTATEFISAAGTGTDLIRLYGGAVVGGPTTFACSLKSFKITHASGTWTNMLRLYNLSSVIIEDIWIEGGLLPNNSVCFKAESALIFNVEKCTFRYGGLYAVDICKINSDLWNNSYINFVSAGYVSAVAGDVGKTVVGGTSGTTGTLLSYDNAARRWTVFTYGDFTNGEAITITTGTGAGTLLASGAQSSLYYDGNAAPNNINFRNSVVKRGNTFGIRYRDGELFKISGCDIEANGDETSIDINHGGIFIDQAGQEAGLGACAIIDGCWFEGNSGIHVKIGSNKYGPGNTIIQNCLGGGGNHLYGVYGDQSSPNRGRAYLYNCSFLSADTYDYYFANDFVADLYDCQGVTASLNSNTTAIPNPTATSYSKVRLSLITYQPDDGLDGQLNPNVSKNSPIKVFANGSAQSVRSLTGCENGAVLTIYATTANTTLVHRYSGGVATDEIDCPGNANYTIPSGSFVLLVRIQNHWYSILPQNLTATGSPTFANLALTGRLNINGATDTANAWINVAGGGSINISGGGSFKSYGLGSPSGTNNEYVILQHDGAETKLLSTKDGAGTFRPFRLYTSDVQRYECNAAGTHTFATNATFSANVTVSSGTLALQALTADCVPYMGNPDKEFKTSTSLKWDAATSTLNIQGSTATSTYPVNVFGTITSWGSSAGFRHFGLGQASDVAAGNTESIFIGHNGSTEGYVSVGKTGTGSYRPYRIYTSNTQRYECSAAGAHTFASLAGTGSRIVEADTNGAITAPDTLSNFVRRKSTDGITASTTQSQGQGALLSDHNVVSVCANANDTVTLPACASGMTIWIRNNGAQTLQIFPASGDAINGAAVNASATLAAGASVVYRTTDSTNWYS